MNSLWMLRQVYKIMEEKGYAIGNLDAMIMIERPKMAPHIPAMRKHVAEHCAVIWNRLASRQHAGKSWDSSVVRKVCRHSVWYCCIKRKALHNRSSFQ